MISPEQSGYVKKRYIGNNIRLIKDIIEYTEKENKKGAAIFCDFEKAFDTVEINFVMSALKHFGFGTSFQKWVSVFYNQINSCIRTNNWLSDKFSIQRGIRKGCPLSALLFLIAAEILACKIKQNTFI